MKTKKKLLVAAVSLLTAGTISLTAASAYFVDKDWTSETIVAGTMTTDNGGITIGKSAVTNVSSKYSASVSARNNISSIKLTTKSYSNASITNPSKYFVYTGTTTPVNDVFFLDNYGNVVYCVDHGLAATDAQYSSTGVSYAVPGTTDLTESSVITDDVKKVLQVGYPNRTSNSYENANNDEELKWATAIAIYIAEGTAYKHDKNTRTNWTDGIIRTDNITLDNTGLITASGLVLSDNYFKSLGATTTKEIEEKRAEYIKEAGRLKELVEDIWHEAQKEEADQFTLDNSEVSTKVVTNTKGNVTGYKVGPFKLNNNVGLATLSSSTSGASFEDEFGNKITTLKSSSVEKPFYVILPSTYSGNTVDVAISTPTKTYPMYYFWSGDETEQKMVVCNQNYAPTITTTVGVGMYSDYKYLNPGDVLNIQWKVTNNGTKSVATRNIVSIYWEKNDFSIYANQKDIIFLYPQTTNTDLIFKDMFNNEKPTIKGNSYSSLGSMGNITVDGKVYQNGYQFILEGDSLDGIGLGAETGNSSEVNYGSVYDDTDSYSDTISFKLALSPFANIHTMGENIIIKVESQAMQYRNSSDGDWSSQWETTATYYYNLSTGQKVNK